MRNRLSGLVYRTLLYILPRHLRRSHGQEMERLFVENLVIETRRLGWWGYPYVWLAAMWDVAATSRAERTANVGRPAANNARVSAKGPSPAVMVRLSKFLLLSRSHNDDSELICTSP